MKGTFKGMCGKKQTGRSERMYVRDPISGRVSGTLNCK